LTVLGHYESPTPELWIISKVVFYLIAMFVETVHKLQVFQSSVAEAEGDVDVPLPTSKSHHSTLSSMSSSIDSSTTSLSRYVDPRVNAIESQASFRFHEIIASQMSESDTMDNLLERFTWPLFVQLLHHADEFSAILFELEHGVGFKDPDVFFKHVDDRDITILRDLATPSAFHPSSVSYYCRPAAKLCIWARGILAKIYRCSLDTKTRATPKESKKEKVRHVCHSALVESDLRCNADGNGSAWWAIGHRAAALHL